ncbi:NAD(P)-dependent oxidoreductase [Nocardioides sp. KIGAM211]|uniref:NAD(P)-dependent oxidoreductase n=1 Tax=Nocardioides luti TaxID=2761101 RepID=A0A7X0RHX5_9ACTN|nr:NAD(P)-dependent oxidoreductase [Nocardioides luti]
MPRSRVVLVGATGFVGSAVAEALAATGEVVPVPSPRLTSTARTVDDVLRAAAEQGDVHADLVRRFAGADAVVNAAGNPDASSLDLDVLYGANALLPAVLLAAAAEAGAPRFVHVSSAVVQNDHPVLDDSEDVHGFSPYSGSKVLGEHVLRDAATPGCHVVRYRPPSVHAPGRRVTRMITRIAGSPAATVARPGQQPTPQALLPNVGSAVAFLATTDRVPPAVVHHPSEGVTVTTLMSDLSGGRAPRRVPRSLARLLVATAKLVGRVHQPTAANARRLELLWLGQGQAPSWLTEAGWQAPVGREGWQALAAGEAS